MLRKGKDATDRDEVTKSEADHLEARGQASTLHLHVVIDKRISDHDK